MKEAPLGSPENPYEISADKEGDFGKSLPVGTFFTVKDDPGSRCPWSSEISCNSGVVKTKDVHPPCDKDRVDSFAGGHRSKFPRIPESCIECRRELLEILFSEQQPVLTE